MNDIKPPVWARFKIDSPSGDICWIGLKRKNMEIYLDYDKEPDGFETDLFYKWNSLLKNEYRYGCTITLPEMPDDATPVVRECELTSYDKVLLKLRKIDGCISELPNKEGVTEFKYDNGLTAIPQKNGDIRWN